jgi:pimeloyl-ACP methyl ester carboxylesterase
LSRKPSLCSREGGEAEPDEAAGRVLVACACRCVEGLVSSGRFRLLLWDYLGYGDSDKELGPAFGVSQLVDIQVGYLGGSRGGGLGLADGWALQVELWRALGVSRTHVVAHDLGDSVALEVLARESERSIQGQGEGLGGVATGRVFLMNGGMLIDLHRPILVQRLLMTPLLGRALAGVLHLAPAVFKASTAGLFSSEHPASQRDLADMWQVRPATAQPGSSSSHRASRVPASPLSPGWQSIVNRDGSYNYHRLIMYIQDRRDNKERWEAALDWAVRHKRVMFYWGMQVSQGRPRALRGPCDVAGPG